MYSIGLVDADPIPYHVGYKYDETAFAGEVKAEIDRMIRNLERELKISDFEFYLTDSSTNFRNEIANIYRYKGGRNSVKPYYWEYAREYLLEKYDAFMCYGFEADDKVADRQLESGDNSVLISIDKDLDCIQGYHYTPLMGAVKKSKSYYMTEYESLLFYHIQWLMGDSTDNIGGAFKVGKTKAEKALKDCTTEEEMCTVVEEVYRKVYGEEPIKFQDWRGRWIEMDYIQIMKENQQLIYMGMDRRPEFNYESNYTLL